MTEKEVIRRVMTMRDWKQPRLAKEAGYKSQSNVTGLLNNNKNGIRIDHVVRMLNAMGCELVVRDKIGSGKEWVIDMKVEDVKYPMPEDRVEKPDSIEEPNTKHGKIPLTKTSLSDLIDSIE